MALKIATTGAIQVRGINPVDITNILHAQVIVAVLRRDLLRIDKELRNQLVDPLTHALVEKTTPNYKKLLNVAQDLQIQSKEIIDSLHRPGSEIYIRGMRERVVIEESGRRREIYR